MDWKKKIRTTIKLNIYIHMSYMFPRFKFDKKMISNCGKSLFERNDENIFINRK